MVDVADLITAVSRLENKLDAILNKLDEKNPDEAIGDWLPEIVVMRLTGLSRSTLFRLRNECLLTSSTLKSKKVFYRKSDLEKLLNKNEGK
jgi:hypothetical protein